MCIGAGVTKRSPAAAVASLKACGPLQNRYVLAGRYVKYKGEKQDDASAVLPACYAAEENNTNWFYYVHNQRTDDPALTYTLGSKTDLVHIKDWSTGDFTVVGESAASNDVKSVTNRTATTEDAKFVQLNIEN